MATAWTWAQAAITLDPERRLPNPAPDLRVRCTRSQERPICQLLWYLEHLNDTLRHGGVQLVEDNSDDLGELRLVALRSAAQLGVPAGPSRSVAQDLLRWLLEQHRCVVYVDLIYSIADSPGLLMTVMRSPGVRKLNIVFWEEFHILERHKRQIITQLMTSGRRIEELAVGCTFDDVDCFAILNPFHRGMLGEMHINLNVSTATEFVSELMENSTLTSLAAGPEIFAIHIFTEYLTKPNQTLKTLALKSPFICAPADLKRLATAICTMSTLEELTVEIMFNETEDFAIFAQVVAKNKTLRSMSLTQPAAVLAHRLLKANSGRSNRSRQETMESWLAACKENSVLERLTVDFVNFEESGCLSFFRAVAENNTLKQIIVLNLPCQGGLKEIYGTIHDSGLAERVLIKSHCLDSGSLLRLPEYSEVTDAVVDTFVQQLHLHQVLEVLRSCSHITSLHLRTDRNLLNDAVYRSLAAIIKEAPSLKDLWLHVYGKYEVKANFCHYVAQSALVRAISSNKNLNTLTLKGISLHDFDCKTLVEAAVTSSNLYHLELTGCHGTNINFRRLMVRALPRCYNLLGVRVPLRRGPFRQEHVMPEVTRRNSSLIIRATRFVMGDERSYFTRALDIVSAHPKLVQMVAERAAVSCGEAKAMIGRALSSIASLNGFMRAAGVVKHRVECCAGRDGQMQLDELNDDCWLHVRKYLNVADVVEPSPL